MKGDMKTAAIVLSVALLLVSAMPSLSDTAADREQSVRDAVEAFAAAFVSADSLVLDGMLTDDYVHVNGSSGDVVDRGRWLRWVASQRKGIERGGIVIAAYRVDDLKVMLHNDAAVVTGVVLSHGKRAGKPFQTRLRFTNVWVDQEGSWRRASFHDSALPEPLIWETVRQLRFAGELDAAREAAESALRSPDNARDEVMLRLELAMILDRVGLHTNTRPVKAALEQIEQAETLTRVLNSYYRGAVGLAKAYWYYRAGMQEKDFALAEKYADEAIASSCFPGSVRIGRSIRARSDATHQLGLIRMFQNERDSALELFDRSLELDRRAGERKWMLGEYHRHVGYVYVISDGDWAAALPYFEKSLQYRKQAEAIDASLFAAISLGTALVRTGDPAAAEAHLRYAIDVAGAIPSPVGIARASVVLGEMYEALDNKAEAIAAYEAARESAASVNYASMEKRAEEALARLKD
jgi:tetratricopeptide (TPR) repeat protein